MGAKGIGVFGYLDMHGKPHSVTWTRLKETVQSGSDQISLVEPVDWIRGEEILITTTSFGVEQTEIR